MNRLRNSCSTLFTAALLSASTSGEARSQQGTPSFWPRLVLVNCDEGEFNERRATAGVSRISAQGGPGREAVRGGRS